MLSKPSYSFFALKSLLSWLLTCQLQPYVMHSLSPSGNMAIHQMPKARLTTVHFKCAFQSWAPSVLISKSQGTKGTSRKERNISSKRILHSQDTKQLTQNTKHIHIYCGLKNSKLAGTFVCVFSTVLTIVVNKIFYNWFSLLGGPFNSCYQNNVACIDSSIFRDM